MSLNKERLRKYLHNEQLVKYVRDGLEIKTKRRRLDNAMNIMIETCVSEAAIDAVEKRRTEYAKIYRNHTEMIEDIFGIVWQTIATIEKYIDFTDSQVDQLPQSVSF